MPLVGLQCVIVVFPDQTRFLFVQSKLISTVGSSQESELFQLQGDWKSDAYKRYLSFCLDDELYVALKMKQHILKNQI